MLGMLLAGISSTASLKQRATPMACSMFLVASIAAASAARTVRGHCWVMRFTGGGMPAFAELRNAVAVGWSPKGSLFRISAGNSSMPLHISIRCLAGERDRCASPGRFRNTSSRMGINRRREYILFAKRMAVRLSVMMSRSTFSVCSSLGPIRKMSLPSEIANKQTEFTSLWKPFLFANANCAF